MALIILHSAGTQLLIPKKGILWFCPLQDPGVLQLVTIYLPRAPEDEEEVLPSTLTHGH